MSRYQTSKYLIHCPYIFIRKLYYNVLGVSDSNANSTKFIEFMLSLILNTIEEIIETEKKVTVKVTQKVTVKVTQKVTVNQKKILDAIKENPHITQTELSEKIGIARKNIISNMKKLKKYR